jgi:hypothetical protein
VSLRSEAEESVKKSPGKRLSYHHAHRTWFAMQRIVLTFAKLRTPRRKKPLPGGEPTQQGQMTGEASVLTRPNEQ